MICLCICMFVRPHFHASVCVWPAVHLLCISRSLCPWWISSRYRQKLAMGTKTRHQQHGPPTWTQLFLNRTVTKNSVQDHLPWPAAGVCLSMSYPCVSDSVCSCIHPRINSAKNSMILFEIDGRFSLCVFAANWLSFCPQILKYVRETACAHSLF